MREKLYEYQADNKSPKSEKLYSSTSQIKGDNNREPGTGTGYCYGYGYKLGLHRSPIITDYVYSQCFFITP